MVHKLSLEYFQRFSFFPFVNDNLKKKKLDVIAYSFNKGEFGVDQHSLLYADPLIAGTVAYISPDSLLS